jgi:demethylmenaquinone methyltransferase/2-methoxy-6-polyprenyl-1,4-benzoquinol methylase
MNRLATDGVLPQGAEKVRVVRTMFDAVAPRYDLVNRIMTFGLDRRWRRATVTALGLPPRSRVVDLACGTGDLCTDLATAGLVPMGFDMSSGMLAAAHATVPMVQADVLRLPLADGSVDGATCGFALRNLVDLPSFLAELARVVRPGGRIGLLEVAEPSNPLLRAGHHFYFNRVVPRIGAALSDGPAYRYLPRSVVYLPPVDVLVATVAGAGFPDVRRLTFSGGVVQLLVATRS